MELILASQSPRRRELMKIISDDFTCIASRADESLPEGTPPDDTVETLALRKALAVRDALPAERARGAVVIGSDTVVYAAGRILGKPKDADDAAAMLRLLSGRTHEVYTGVAFAALDRREVFHTVTQVEFYPLTDAEIARYCATGDPIDKAGAYGIQGPGSVLIRGIRGDFFTVVGFPVAEVRRRLEAFLD